MALKAMMCGSGSKTSAAPAPDPAADDEEEDPIMKAEREFFESIKKVNVFTKCDGVGT
jgi:hypothetical protein